MDKSKENSTMHNGSRLIVKNLPNSVSVDKLRTLFGSKGDVTDVQLKYTSDGRFRSFGFVGFKTDEQADKACEYFNDTYIGAIKIKVEKCAALGDPEKPRAWSKYAPEKSEKSKSKRKNEKLNDDVVIKKKKEEEILERCKEDADFLEFLQSHKKSSAWANDDILEELEKSVSQSKKKEAKSQKEVKIAKDSNGHDKSRTSESIIESKNIVVGKSNVKVLPENEYFTIKLRDLPKKARKKDIKLFFGSIHLQSIRIPPKIRGIAYVGFKTEKERNKALSKNKNIMLGKKISVYNYVSKNSNIEDSTQNKSKWAVQQEALEKETETVGESGRIFIRNLSYSATEDDIRQLFEKFGPVTEVNLPLDRLTRQIKGIGFVSFMLPEHASNAFSALDGTTFQGRMLHLLPSKSKDDLSSEDLNAGSSYKTAKEIKKKKTADQSFNWNTLFLGQNAVSEVVSTKYGVSKEAFLLDNNDEKDSYQVSTAVRMALAETEVVADTKSFLEQNGVSLEAFEKRKKPERSRTVLLVRNLGAGTPLNELTETFTKYGELGRVVMPPSGITAIVEFLEPSEARRAFTNLAYTKFRQMPMYLEWAPVDTFKGPFDHQGKPNRNIQEMKPQEKQDTEVVKTDTPNEKKLHSQSHSEKTSNIVLPPLTIDEVVDNDMIPEPDTTLFVKNLNFTTEEAGLKVHFKECGPIYSTQIATKRDPKQPGKMLSMGYGFVQYYLSRHASNAIKTLQGSVLQNHTLELKKSNRTLQTVSTELPNNNPSKDVKESTKILIRNIPFQATRKEITDLFKTFGQIKAVRLPTKMDGSGEHRGFAFVEFQTTKDASFAFTTLSKSTHLYGRRLVLEWAAADETVEELRAKTAKKYNLQIAGERLNKSSKTKQMMRYFDAQTVKSAKDDEDEDSQ